MKDWKPVADNGPVVLGLHLGPLTLGHLELFHELELDIFGAWTPRDVAMIALVLTQPAHESRRDLSRWWMKLFLWWIGRRSLKVDLQAHADTLSEWIADQLSGPRVVSDLKRKSRSVSAPLHISLLAGVLSRLHLGLESARAMPVKTAKQLVLAAAESEGQADLWTEREDNWMSSCRAWDAYEREQRNN